MVANDPPELLDVSSAQRAIWFDEQLSPGTIRYHVTTAVRLHAAGDPMLLRRALQHIVDSDPSLRTTFVERDGEPLRRVCGHCAVALEVVDADGWTADEIDERLKQEHMRRYELEDGPLVRFLVLRLSESEHILAIGMHHLITDLWSNAVLGYRVAATYKAFARGDEPPGLDRQSTYTDFVEAEQSLLASPESHSALDFWKPVFADWSPQDLISDRTGVGHVTGIGAVHQVEVDEDLATAIRRVADERGLSVRSMVLAAFQAALHLAHGLDQVVVAEIKANRSVRDARVIGCYMNPVPRSVSLTSDLTLELLADVVHRDAAASRPHERYPFERLLHELRPGHGPAPFFAASFSWQKTSRVVASSMVEKLALGESGETTHLEGFDVQPFAMPIRSAPVPLSLLAAGSGEHLELALEYQTERFEPASIERFSCHLVALLGAMVATPASRIVDVDLISDQERTSWRTEWEAARRPIDDRLVAHRLVEDQVARSPDAVAVRDAVAMCSYRDLDARANRLAHHLRSIGVSRGDVVGICLDRTIDMVVAMLAVWKCGAAYVPLDPAFPPDRLQVMISDASVRVVVSRSRLVDALPERDLDATDGSIVVDLDSERELTSAAPTASLDVGVVGEDLAYVIFTSGSTGRPKGVAVTHSNVVNFLVSMKRRPGLTADDVMLASTTLSFDISVLELILPLVVGAEVVLVERDVALDPRRLMEVMQCVTVAQGTPTMWRMLIEAGWGGHPGLTVLCGGEPMSRALADRLLQRCDAVWNLYGPTETTIWSSVARITVGQGPVLLGEPVDNTRLYVLHDRRLVPDGTPGELWIAGRGVARGYIGRREMTAERFADDPFFGVGERMYRTGDRVRRRLDGELEFFGRIDDQIKLRGHRIELGEIEAVLAQHPWIVDAVTTVWEYGVGDERLVSYYVPAAGTPLQMARGSAEDELRAHLASRLPHYMIPSAFLPLDRLPLTPNNKLDRRRLPDPRLFAGKAPSSHQFADEPRVRSDDVLDSVLRIYREVLGDVSVGANDNFFELGGHSLLATRLASRVRHQLEREISVRDVFDHPSPSMLSAVVSRLPALPRSAGAVRMGGDAAVHARPSDETFVLTHSQERMWFMQMLHPDSVAYNLAAAMRVHGPVDPDAVRWALDQLVQRHTALRTSFFQHEGAPRLRVEDPFSPVLEVHDVTDIDDDEHRREIVNSELSELTRRPFDLSQLPLFRVEAFRLADNDHVLGVVMHHIISDQWSFGVLCRELASLYEARRLGLQPASSDSALRPELYGQMRRTEVDADAMEGSLIYWRKQLADLPIVELPTVRPRPATASTEGRTLVVTMPADLTAAVRELAHAESASEFMVLLAAFQLLVHRMTGALDVPVGVPIANRHWIESEPLITSLVNTLVIRTDLSGATTFSDVVQRVRDVTLDAYEHQDMPFERLVKELAPGRDLSRSPLFQLFFNVQNAPFEMPEIDGLRFEVLQPERRAAQFDLSLTVDTAVTHTLTLEYAAELFDDEQMHRLLNDYLATLRGGVMGDEGTQLDGAPATEGVVPIDVAPKERSSNGRRVDGGMPREGLEQDLAVIWGDALGVSGIERDDDFFELGGHSLLAIRIMSDVHRLTGRRPPMTVLFQAPTIAELAAALDSEGWLTPWTSLVEVHAGGTATPLFYVAPFRISALSFHGLSAELGDDLPFYVLQPQGMESDDRIHERIEDMAAHYVREMKTVQPHGPYRIGGHCAGGWVALEMARQLQVAGDRVERLIVVDVEPPGISPPRVKWRQYLISRLVLYGGSGRLLDAIRWQIDLWRDRRRNRRMESVDETRLHEVRTVHREAHRLYRGGKFDGRLVFIRSEEWSRLPDKAWHLEWSQLTSAGIEVAVVAGAHSAVLHGANVEELGSAIRGALAD